MDKPAKETPLLPLIPLTTQRPVASDNDLEYWMTNLPTQLRANCPLFRLAIPGSHDSMMYKMDSNKGTTPEVPAYVSWLLAMAPGWVENWVVTQQGDVTEQLMNGIRYFDFRVCLHEDEFMFCHGVFSGESLQPLRDIKAFLDDHPKEVVILDFQHIYRCSPEDHDTYCMTLLDIFEGTVYPCSENMLATCTLDEMANKHQQVIIIYRDENASTAFWVDQLDTPWPNTTDIGTLRRFLDENVEERMEGHGYVTQCVLTPTVEFIVANLLSNLKLACARPVLIAMYDWIRTRPSGPVEWPGFNIFIADFVHLNEYEFVKAVLSCNKVPSIEGHFVDKPPVKWQRIGFWEWFKGLFKCKK